MPAKYYKKSKIGYREMSRVDKARYVELLGMLPEPVRDMARNNPEKLIDAIQIELKNREKNYPSINFVPNIAQERALRCLAEPHKTYGNYPKKIYFCAANGIGKTAGLVAILLAGTCLGPEFVNREYCNWRYFYDIQRLKTKRKLQVRLVCDAKDMKEDGGSLYQQIRKWIPTAKFKDKTGEFYQSVIIGDVHVDVKTFNMPVVAHAGPDYDIVIFNEPCDSEEVFQENFSRTRMGGRLFLFATPLNSAPYIAREVKHDDGPDGELYFTSGNIWENCKDVPGTRGTLTRADIESLERAWRRQGEHVYRARAYGEFAAYAGVIFELFRDDIHVVDAFKIPDDWNIYHLLDPHEVKPPFSIWIAKDPLNNSYVIAEYPMQVWDQMLGTPLTIKHFCRDFDLIEKGKNSMFPYMPKGMNRHRIGDPNRMNVKYPNSGRTLRQEYQWCGYDFECDANDDITLGHDRIRDLLYYDVQRQVDSTNCPRLYVFRQCKNVIRAFKEYMTDPNNGRIIETWKCPIDLLRYYCDKTESWHKEDAGYTEYSNDYAEIQRGRDPDLYGDNEIEEDAELVYPR